MGLTWDCVNFEEKKIKINKTLQRVSKEALEKTRQDEEIFSIFPEKKSDSKTILVIKKAKTKFSNRGVFISEQLKNEFITVKEQIEKEKSYRGREYNDYTLCQKATQ